MDIGARTGMCRVMPAVQTQHLYITEACGPSGPGLACARHLSLGLLIAVSSCRIPAGCAASGGCRCSLGGRDPGPQPRPAAGQLPSGWQLESGSLARCVGSPMLQLSLGPIWNVMWACAHSLLPLDLS